MRSLTILCAAALLVCAPALAQQDKFEIGTKAGISVAIPDEGDAEVFIGVPGTGSFLFLPSLYATFFMGKSLMIEPQILFQFNSATDDATFTGIIQGGYMFSGEPNSFYAALNVGWAALEGSAESALVGGGAGYRFKFNDALGFRVEALYRRWLCSGCDLGEVITSFGVGAAF
jgi:hypothetical protein